MKNGNALPFVALSLVLVAGAAGSPAAFAQTSGEVDRLTAEVMPRVIEWRRDIHQHPELGNREFRTSKLIAEYLASIGYEVKTGVARTGVVAVLRGGRAPATGGPVVALRADMDALPVTELVDLPFKSTEKAEWNGQQVGVMHACGHDNHVAILLGAATVLSKLKGQLPGTVKLIFQPAEEGPPVGESPAGAELMVKEGVLDDPKVDAVFGLHVFPYPAGEILYRSGPLMASGDNFKITLTGKQTHGAAPWSGTVNITEAPAVVTVGRFSGGLRSNIIPEKVELEGTVRAFDETVRQDIHRRLRDISTKYAEAAGATALVEFGLGYPVTRNDPALTERMLPTLRRVAGADKVRVGPLAGASEDFSFFQQKVPGMYFMLGVTPRDQDYTRVPVNHSPSFFADESALPVGVKAMASLAIDFLNGKGTP
jgi:metal-dependent amidase/aminoacylase/carboxypeptidase family protein